MAAEPLGEVAGEAMGGREKPQGDRQQFAEGPNAAEGVADGDLHESKRREGRGINQIVGSTWILALTPLAKVLRIASHRISLGLGGVYSLGRVPHGKAAMRMGQLGGTREPLHTWMGAAVQRNVHPPIAPAAHAGHGGYGVNGTAASVKDCRA